MSASEAGSSDSMASSSPGHMSPMASRVLTIGIGQKSPMQSISLSGMDTFGSVTMPRYGILGLAAQSRRRGCSLTIRYPLANTYKMAQAKRAVRPKSEEPVLDAGGARR